MKLRYILLPFIFSPFLFIPLVITFVILIAVIATPSLMDMLNEEDRSYEIEFGSLSELVLAYEPIVREFAKQEGIEEYVPVILAIMMQESGGNGNDPMQVSEAVCGSIGCIKSPMESIEHGVKNFKKLLEKANGDLMLTLQAYNFGSYFIDWVKERGGKYTQELATQFSREMYQKEVSRGRGGMYSCAIGNAKELGSCFGDYLYVQHVLRYLNYGSNLASNPNGWVMPLNIEMRVTSPFGMRTLKGITRMHYGTDYSCNQSHVPIFSVDEGEVVVSTYNSGGYGNYVIVKHDNSLYTLYAHMNERFVKVGNKVKKGQMLGTCGTTGRSYGIHLHFEVRTTQTGGQIDPESVLRPMVVGK